MDLDGIVTPLEHAAGPDASQPGWRPQGVYHGQGVERAPCSCRRAPTIFSSLSCAIGLVSLCVQGWKKFCWGAGGGAPNFLGGVGVAERGSFGWAFACSVPAACHTRA